MWVGGDQGRLFHFDGSAWQQVETGTDGTLSAVWTDGTQVVVGGGFGVLRRR